MRKLGAFFRSELVSAKYYFFIILFFIGLFAILNPKTYVGQNQSMYLYAGNLFLEGQRPFLDFFDINPPLVVYWSAILVWLNKQVSIPFTTFFNLGIFFWFGILTYVTIRLLWRNKILTVSASYWVGIFLSLVFYHHCILSQIGERDQILAMALIPYLVLKTIDDSCPTNLTSLWIRLWIGLNIGLAVAFKPIFFLHFIASELFVFFKSKYSWRVFFTPEAIVAIFIQILYYAYLILLPEPTWTHFWLEHIPLVQEFYSSFARKATDNLSDLYWMAAASLAAVASFTAISNPKNSLLNLFGINFIVAVIVFFFQRNFFPYHLVVIENLMVVLCLLMWWENSCNSSRSIIIKRLMTVILFCILFSEAYRITISTYHTKIKPTPRTTKIVTTIQSIYKAMSTFTKPGDFVLPLSASPLASYPWILYHDLKIGSRNLFQYQISFFGTERYHDGYLYFDEKNDHLNQLEKIYIENLIADVKRLKPQMIYYYQNEALRQNLPEGFPLDAYLVKVGLISEIEKDYDKISWPADVTIYIRKKSSP